MQKINFKNLPSTDTPINATNLNLMQDNIENAIEDVKDTIPTIENSLDSDSTVNGASVHAVNDKFNTITSYSTTETVIGTWIDGKPLYRKVIEISSLPNATIQDYNTNISNIDKCVNLYGATLNGLPLNGTRPEDSTAAIGVWFDTSSMKIRISTGKDRSNIGANIIFEYTKTTD